MRNCEHDSPQLYSCIVRERAGDASSTPRIDLPTPSATCTLGQQAQFLRQLVRPVRAAAADMTKPSPLFAASSSRPIAPDTASEGSKPIITKLSQNRRLQPELPRLGDDQRKAASALPAHQTRHGPARWPMNRAHPVQNGTADAYQIDQKRCPGRHLLLRFRMLARRVRSARASAIARLNGLRGRGSVEPRGADFPKANSYFRRNSQDACKRSLPGSDAVAVERDLLSKGFKVVSPFPNVRSARLAQFLSTALGIAACLRC